VGTNTVVDLEKMTVTLGTQTQGIIRFDTWWVLPSLGIAVSLDEAKQVCNEQGLPLSVIRPITAAICEGGLYEVML
jgi:hypothetical protein